MRQARGCVGNWPSHWSHLRHTPSPRPCQWPSSVLQWSMVFNSSKPRSLCHQHRWHFHGTSHKITIRVLHFFIFLLLNSTDFEMGCLVFVCLKSLTNGIYKGCIHRAVVNSMNARKSLAFFLCPSHDKVVRAPEELVEKSPPRKYPDYKWPMLLEMTQKRYRPDCNTLEAFKTWVKEGKAMDNGSTIIAPSA